MRSSFPICAPLLCILASFANAQSGWDLTFSDEFSGTANTYPDPSKWNVEVNGNPPNGEAEAYVKSTQNVSLNGKGQLELTALRQNSGNKQFTSGKINSAGKFMQTYGRWEALIKLPAGTGFWPAFWMLGGNNGCGGWPSCGEIDIIENRGRLAMTSSSAMHGPGYSGNTPLAHTYNLPGGSTSFFDSFHLFAMEWNATQVRFYVDSSLHYTVNRTDVQKYGNWVYNHDFYTILNLAVGGQFDGMKLPPADAFPAKVVVDYVHIYKPGTGQLLSALRPARLRRGRDVGDLDKLIAYDFTGRVRLAPRSGAMPLAGVPASGSAAVLLPR